MKYSVVLLSAATFVLSGCGGGGGEQIPAQQSITKEELGAQLFFDQNLSLNRGTSCATCHDPEHGFVDARFAEDGVDQSIFVHGAFSVGDDGLSLGGRNAPTAAYAQFSPEFSQQNGVYIGGQFHDGRAATLKVQAGGPPLDGAEMMMSDKSAVIDRIKENTQYLEAFETLYGADIFDDVNSSYEAMREAIGKFEKTELFAPFDSKYDRFLECKENGGLTSECYEADNWSDAEILGYSLFFSENNTNCALCHTLNSQSEASKHELFTNYEFENIGTPRNVTAMERRAELGLQDANATFLGLGGTVNDPAHYGKTKVPTLRNVAITAPYMSNGVFQNLRTVLEFYDHMAGQGDHPINPETFEPWDANDYNATINHEKLSDTKALSDEKIRALEAFLRTLTDKRYEHLLEPLAP
ncbi:cytochrome-c peroxidase [Sulfurimonas marina]|uniref:Methylamine utilization protein MauG n=1 Tax=Sulfurimonas marina TaxID=2590551 RepID=A0A7M1AXI5_9BACT|nr:cytochrome c peroxidase [Sulfurimonas marina]QOP42177.1 methylamine utilization protein MauG [Sulfurimonas marina]